MYILHHSSTGDSRESGSHHDSILLPNVPPLRDDQKHFL